MEVNVGGICGSNNDTLPPVGEVVRAIELGNRTGISCSDIVSSQNLTSVMLISLLTLYVEL